MPNLSDEDVRAILSAHETGTIGGTNDQASRSREAALKRYRGDPQGDEEEGQSKVVMTDTQDAVESVLPSLLRIFTSSNRGVEFMPENQNDEENAKQATEYINFLFNRDNDGFNILYTAFKDTLMYRNGLVKVWWDSGEQRIIETIEGIDEGQLAVLANDPDVEILEQTQRLEDISGSNDLVTMFDIRYERTLNKGGRLHVEAIPPEEYIIAAHAKNNQDFYSAHITLKTEGELLSQVDSYDLTKKDILALPTAHGTTVNESGEVQNRFKDRIPTARVETSDTTTRLIRVAEHYVDMDFDDDGISEKRMITTFGHNNEIIAQNVTIPDGVPVIDFSIIKMQHNYESRSLDDNVKDIGEIKTAVIRQTLNNFYQANFPKRVVDPNQIEVDDLLSPSANGIIRGNPAAYQELPPMTLGSSPFNLLEYIETVKENRTGITRANQGLEADTLNKTATGISLLFSASQQRQELMVRILAEGVKRMYGLMLKTVCRNQDIARVIRLNDEWVQVDPRVWNKNMDASISVGLGSGSKEQQIGALLNIKNLQVEALQIGQLLGTQLVSANELFNTYSRISEVSGFSEPTDFFLDPEQQPQQPQQLPQQQAQGQPQQGQPQQGQPVPEGLPPEALQQAALELENEGIPTQ